MRWSIFVCLFCTLSWVYSKISPRLEDFNKEVEPNVFLEGYHDGLDIPNEKSLGTANVSPDLSLDLFALPDFDPLDASGPLAAGSLNLLAPDSLSLLAADSSNLLAAGSAKCVPPLNRMRPRSEHACYGNSDYQEALGIKTTVTEKVSKYWCSESSVAGYGNIPVCVLDSFGDFPQRPPQTSTFFTVQNCNLSKVCLVSNNS
jgi:hypothetical protein